MIDIDALLALAGEATPGPWVADELSVYAGGGRGRVARLPGWQHDSDANAAYIAAVNPAAVVELIEMIKRAQSVAQQDEAKKGRLWKHMQDRCERAEDELARLRRRRDQE